MKTRLAGVCAFLFMAAVGTAQEAAPAVSGAAPLNESLRAELVAMKAEDQRVRKDSSLLMNRQQLEERRQVDARNLARMETIIAEHGWPGKSLVGSDGASAAWMVVQHGSPSFQEKCLPLLERAFTAGEATGLHYAYLLDRVRMHQDKPQVYGSQFRTTDGMTMAHPIQDPEHLDERRRSVGLGPWADYERQMLGEIAVGNLPLRQELFQMTVESRRVRTKRLAEQTEEQKEERRRVDAAHGSRLKEILATHGWPGRTLIGADAAGRFFTLMQMQGAALRAEGLPLAEQAMQAGEVTGGDYASFVDQVRLEQGRPVVYGAIREVQSAEGKPIPVEIEDAARVDERRRAIGLEPLKR